MLRLQWPVILTTTALGMLWQLPPTVGPLIFGRAIDEGIVPGDTAATLQWAGLLLLVTLIGATVRHPHAHAHRAQLADRASTAP